MKKIRFRRIVAACMALLIVTSTTALSSAWEGVELTRPAVTAHAEEGTATFDAETKTLTLRGHVRRDLLQQYAATWDTDNGEWESEYDIQKIVAAEGTVLPQDCIYLFWGFVTVKEIDLKNADTSNVTNMGDMFYDCNALTSLDLSSFDTSNVTDMSYMFYNCKALTSLDLSSFDTRNVRWMYNIFYGCENLTSLDLSSFDTSMVEDMYMMFENCENLSEIVVGEGWRTEKVSDSDVMFANCTKLPNYNENAVNKTNANTGYGGYLNAPVTLSEGGSTLTLRGHFTKEQI